MFDCSLLCRSDLFSVDLVIGFDTESAAFLGHFTSTAIGTYSLCGHHHLLSSMDVLRGTYRYDHSLDVPLDDI